MTGTDRQIAWAQDIINNKLAVCEKRVSVLAENMARSNFPESFQESIDDLRAAQAVLEKLFESDARLEDAAWVINHRDNIYDADAIVYTAYNLADDGDTVITYAESLANIASKNSVTFGRK